MESDVYSDSKSYPRSGITFNSDGSATFTLWAPRQKVVLLHVTTGAVETSIAMEVREHGFFTATVPNIESETTYAYSIDDSKYADPCSRWQPFGVEGRSKILNPDQFVWSDHGWKGIPQKDFVIYELHVGMFTKEGTFDAIIPRLRQLTELGITAIELMPISQFPGNRNWGYDGVFPFCAQDSYGGPLGVQRLVNAAHAAGLAVILDLVFNHVGPESSYLEKFGHYHTSRYKTPWGAAMNFDDEFSDPVRDWVCDCVAMWLKDFHFDGVRLDAVHAIFDQSATHILSRIKKVADAISTDHNRQIQVIAESDLNDARIVTDSRSGGIGMDAQWSDDFHHAVHAFLTGEQSGYYSDYGTVTDLQQVMKSPFLFTGQYSKHRKRKHGAPLPNIALQKFIVFIQNHDQIGNRVNGERLSNLIPVEKLHLGASLLLLSPYIPMLFMGEEYGETNPFPYVCSFQNPELVEAVQSGRKKEFGYSALNNDIPDCNAESTYNSGILNWEWKEGSINHETRSLYQALLAIRKKIPLVTDFASQEVNLILDEKVLEIKRTHPDSVEAIYLYFNMSEEEHALRIPPDVIFRTASVRADFRWKWQLEPYECVVSRKHIPHAE